MPIPSTIATVYGNVLRSKRQELGLTFRELQKSAFISIGFASDVERGEKGISSHILEVWLRALDYPMSDFFIDVANELLHYSNHQ